MAAPTAEFATLSLSWGGFSSYGTAQSQQRWREKRLWEAIDCWISYNTHELSTDAKFRLIRDRVTQLRPDQENSWVYSDDRDATFIAYAYFKDRELSRWMENQSMDVRASSLISTLESRFARAFEQYKRRRSNAEEVVEELQALVVAADRDVTMRTHSDDRRRRNHLDSLLTVLIRNLSEAACCSLGPGAQRKSSPTETIRVSRDSVARILFVDESTAREDLFMLGLLAKLRRLEYSKFSERIKALRVIHCSLRSLGASRRYLDELQRLLADT